MAFDLSTFLTSLTGRDPSMGVAAMSAAQTPSDADYAEASAERAEHAGDGPDIEPEYVPARPLIDETHAALIIGAALRAVLLGSPAPASSVVISVPVPAGTAVQVVPASAGRRRRVQLANPSGVTVYISPDRREDSSGFALTDAATGQQLDTSTPGAVWAYVAGGGNDGQVDAWVDHYDAEG